MDIPEIITYPNQNTRYLGLWPIPIKTPRTKDHRLLPSHEVSLGKPDIEQGHDHPLNHRK